VLVLALYDKSAFIFKLEEPDDTDSNGTKYVPFDTTGTFEFVFKDTVLDCADKKVVN
jgi:hypothetical protein